jgi:colanic acid/amylovoran biosynthesis glycosyltransferase
MKIAYIFTQFPSGQVSNSTRVFAMLERGHKVTVYANSKSKSILYKDELERFSDDLKIVYINKPPLQMLQVMFKDFIKNPLSFIKTLIKVSNKKIFYQHHTKRIMGGSGKNNNLLVTKKKSKIVTSYFRYRAIRDNDFDLIISFFGTIGNNYLFTKSLYPNSIYMTYFVGFDYSSQVYRTGDVDFYKDLFHECDYICAKSNFSKQTLVGLGCDEDKIVIDYNGIDIKKFSSKTYESELKTLKFIIVSRLEKKKCHLLILKAFQNVLESFDNFEFTIVGDGPERQKLEDYISKDKNLVDRVSLVGLKTQSEIKELLQLNHIFIHPSSSSLLNGSMEDTPTAILEAMAIGLPIISTYHAGIPDLVVDDYNGKLVPERNLKLLEKAITTFFKDKSLVSEFGKNSRLLVEEKFDSRKNAMKNEDFYKSILLNHD